MAKIYYVTENAPDYAQVNFFKTEKEALEYGISELPNFEMGDEPMNDEEADGEEYYQGDSLTFKKGILFSYEDAEVYVQEMDEDKAREYVEEEVGEYGSAIFFDGFKRGMYGYLGSAAAGKDYKWDWDGADINESKSNSGLRYVKLFEQFVNEAKYSTSDMKKLKAFAKDVADEIYDEYEEDFNSGDLDEEEYNTEGMLDYLIDWASGDPVSKVIKDFNWKSLEFELGLR